MRALLYHSAHDVRVESVPDPIIQEADDIILKVTATPTSTSIIASRLANPKVSLTPIFMFDTNFISYPE